MTCQMAFFLSQRKYIKKLFKDFGIEECNLASNPIDKSWHLIVDMQSDLANASKYCSLVDFLFYVVMT